MAPQDGHEINVDHLPTNDCHLSNYRWPTPATREVASMRCRPNSSRVEQAGPLLSSCSELATDEDSRRIARGWKRILYLSTSVVFFVLGALGVMLPGLPATPFLLLTSYFLVRSSPRLNSRLLDSRIFGPILIDWQVHGGVRPHVKIKASVVVVISLAVTVYLSGFSLVPKLLVVFLALVGLTVIFRLPKPRSCQSLNATNPS